MKTIGLLGGTSWPSTLEYYKLLSTMAQERLGGHHSAKLILYSIDFHEIKSRYHGGWDKIPELLKKELQKLASMNPDLILICNNTLHKAYDMLEVELDLDIPILHMPKITADKAKEKGLEKVLLHQRNVSVQILIPH